ncbi:uncharacterized protein LOC129775036 [Toxorhynchites rutilus septentrionalis]|uniref:uncharacterized protein LOC129775036 n=1 Tax=Toxorhynchites rutilus septentrionalis TaxID=329112 RepID=UPI00247A023E|nr:uncharacterized protein LOC129775036 [Toxorhynchites rutilus septentrionalis]
MKHYVPEQTQELLSGLKYNIVQVKTKTVRIGGVESQILLVRADDSLLCLKYIRATELWQHQWNRSAIFSSSDEIGKSPWLVTRDGFIVVRTRTGIHIFKLDENMRLNLLASDGRYHDIYGWNRSDHLILFGHFYSDATKIGIVSRDNRGNLAFEAVIKEGALKRSQQPIWKMDTDPHIGSSWMDEDTDILLEYVDSTDQQAFVLRTAHTSLSIFKFGSTHRMEQILLTNAIPFSAQLDDRILFGRFSRGEKTLRDILYFNQTGATCYIYSQQSRDYEQVFYIPEFRKELGWSAVHTEAVNLYDIERDGIDEIFYDGPSGLNAVGVLLSEYLVFNILHESSFDVFDRHVKSYIITGDKKLITMGENSLKSFAFRLKAKDSSVNSYSDQNSSELANEMKTKPLMLPSVTFPSALPLHDQLNVASLLYPRNPLLGALDFTVPLIDIPNAFGLSISQSINFRESSPADVLGVGWSFPVDCIYIDRRGSIFPIDHNYYLVKDGSQSQLKQKFDGLTNEHISFALDDSTDVTIKFHKSQNSWEVQTASETLFYGTLNNIDWIQWEPGSEEWPIVDNSSVPTKLKPVVWFLAMKKDRHENFLRYIYSPEYSTLTSGEPYVRTLNLLRIVSNNDDSVRFAYIENNNSKLLSGFLVRTRDYTQEVKFVYSTDSSATRLAAITQFETPILEFKYNGPKEALTEIHYPNGLVSKFSYNSIQFPAASVANKLQFFSDAQVRYGPNYMMVGGKTKSGQVHIKARDIVGSDTTQMSGLAFPHLGKEVVINFEILTAELFFLVVLTHANHKEICLFRQTTQGWSSEASYMKLSKESVFMVGRTFILIRSGSKLAVLQLINNRWDIKPVLNNLSEDIIVQAFSYAYVVYDDLELSVGFQDYDGEWITKTVLIGTNLMKSSLLVFDQFDVDQKTIELLKYEFKKGTLHIHHNAIIIRTLSLQGQKLFLNVHFRVFNAKYDLIHHETVSVLVEDLSRYLLELPPMNGNNFKLGYTQMNGKFKLSVKSHTGSIIDEIKRIKEDIETEIRQHPGASEAEKNKYRNESYQKLDSDLQQIYRNITVAVPFAIDPAKFGVYVNSDHVVAASHKFRFDGLRWNKEKIGQETITLSKFEMKLGDSIVLAKPEKNETFKLYDTANGKKLLLDLLTDNGNDLFPSYPAFVGVQKPNERGKIFTFENKRLHYLPDGEVISRMSNPYALITTTEDGKEITIRSLKSFLNYRQSVIIKQELIHSKHDKRSTVFEYDSTKVKSYSDGFAFTKSKVLPGGKSELYGWYQEAFNLADTRNSSKMAYNSKGIVVKTFEPSEGEEPEKIDDDKFLTDRRKRHKIVDFRPYSISQEVVSYYGFEPYEVNRIGGFKKWAFDEKMIVEEDSNHFLRLQLGSSISGRLEPKLRNVSFLVSCWMRANQSSTIPGRLSTRITGSGRMLQLIEGKVQRTIADWSYVESFYEADPKHGQVELDIRIKNTGSSPLDVDHLRVTPMNFDFEANIFDRRNGKVRAVLKNSGALQHVLHDPFGNIVARISEVGIVDNYALKSRNYCVRKNGSLNSRVEMKPMLGEIEYTNARLVGQVHKSLKYTPHVFVVRFLYKFEGVGSIVTQLAQFAIRMERNTRQTIIKITGNDSFTIDSEGEFTVLLTKSFIVVWIQGHLVSENKHNTTPEQLSHVVFKVSGQASLYENMYLYDPMVNLYYLNKLGLTVQEIELKDHDSVNMRQIIYDDLDRPIMKTKWTELKAFNGSLLNYNPNFITSLDKILATGKAEGLVNERNPDCEGYPYTRISYRDDPLEAKAAFGLPGKEFAVEGPLSIKYGSNLNISFLKVLFPAARGYRHDFELHSGGTLMIRVYDARKNKVAEVVRVIGHDHRLTTFEYNDQNRLIRMLPPSYHQRVNTFARTTPFDEQVFSEKEARLRELWSVQYRYDDEGRLIEKVTPDSGKQEFMYSKEGLLRFFTNSDRESSLNYTIYHTYRFDGNVIERGLLNFRKSELPTYLPNYSILPKSSNFAMFDFGENEISPSYRSRVIKSRKVSDGVMITETLIFDENKNLLNQIFVSPNSSISVDYRYMNDKLVQMTYPIAFDENPLKISYDYNAKGLIKEVRIGKKILASMSYTPLDSVKEIHFEPQDSYGYKRTFTYNQPGYLSKIQDNFLSETVDYISGGYGSGSFGDGTVSVTTFNATWHTRSNLRLIKLNPTHFTANHTTTQQAALCFESLKRTGHLDSLSRPQKTLYPAEELKMPLICNTGSRAYHISSILTTNGFPEIYGNRYDYENHKQLIKAKYFQNSNEKSLNPLTQLTFSQNIRGINAAESRDIWSSLKGAGFIITDCSNSKSCHALPGMSLFHPNITNHVYATVLETLFAKVIRARKDLSEQVFQIICEVWHGDDEINRSRICRGIWKELQSLQIVGTRSDKSTSSLNPELKETLKKYSRYLGEIVFTLHDHFSKSLSSSDGDVQSYDIDPNGNHVHFYTGFKRYRMEYHQNTNKISKVYCTDLRSEGMREVEYPMKHNFEGSVTYATHKGIDKIVYDPLMNRATLIEMSDGRKLIFRYDVRGERIFKQVRDKNDDILQEKYYVRDIKGKCLVDYDITHFKDNKQVHVRSSAYIYSEATLIGFMRDGEFYSVYADHEGSTRLVIKNGEVVAAYDYYPYGQILREYNSLPEGGIMYRYTGQEWDEETGLYNFHARLYDPEIGRFYQIDPKEQYPSPYVYAGNSPISMVDPDGQFAFLIPIIALAVVGGYFGASAANNSFNPTKWKLRPTLIGGVLGALSGALAPTGIGASFTFLTTTVGMSGILAGTVIAGTTIGFAFIGGASANKNWNPAEWNWSSPGTWNSLFSGGLIGATLFAGIAGVHKHYMALTGIEKIVFVGVVTGSSTGVALFAGSLTNDGNFKFWEWDWKNPDTVWMLTLGATFGMSVSPDLHNIQKSIVNNVKNLKEVVNTFKTGDMKLFLSDAKAYLKDTQALVGQAKQTFSDLAKQMIRSRGSGLAQMLVVRSNQNDTFVQEVIDTVSSALVVVSGGVDEDGQDIKNMNEREGLRMKRSINCCQLQQFNQHNDPVKDSHTSMLNSCGTLSSPFDYIFSTIYARIKYFFSPHEYSSEPSGLIRRSFERNPRNAYILRNCYHVEVQSETQRVHCYGYDSQYIIFSKSNPGKYITEDFYSHCSPIEYAAQPSVVCDGESSSLLFTPNVTTNPLDHLNGWLMLTLIAPIAYENIKSYLSSILKPSSSEKEPMKLAEDPEVNVEYLTQKVNNLRNMIYSSKLERKERIIWAEHIFEDLLEDFKYYSENSQIGSSEDLLDRVKALEEELVETFAWSYIAEPKYNVIPPVVSLSAVNNDLSMVHRNTFNNANDRLRIEAQ